MLNFDWSEWGLAEATEVEYLKYVRYIGPSAESLTIFDCKQSETGKNRKRAAESIVSAYSTPWAINLLYQSWCSHPSHPSPLRKRC